MTTTAVPAGLPAAVAPARSVHAVAFPHVTVLLNARTGRVITLTGRAGAFWAALAEHGSPTRAATATGLAPEAVAGLVAALLTGGVLAAYPTPVPWPPQIPGVEPGASWGSQETPARLTCHPPAARPWRARAVLALALTLAVRHAGPRRSAFVRLLALAGQARHARRPATHADATAALSAVRRVARWVPARVACLEESVAAVVTLALAGAQATWRHGIATDPVRLHAWIETGAGPVGEPASIGDYTPLPRLLDTPARKQKGRAWTTNP